GHFDICVEYRRLAADLHGLQHGRFAVKAGPALDPRGLTLVRHNEYHANLTAVLPGAQDVAETERQHVPGRPRAQQMVTGILTAVLPGAQDVAETESQLVPGPLGDQQIAIGIDLDEAGGVTLGRNIEPTLRVHR